MSWLRNLCSCGAVFVIAPTTSIAQEHTITVHPEQKYSVDGLAVGAPVAPNSSAYRQYVCKPSDQYQNFTRCRESHIENGIQDRKSTRLNSSHLVISYAVFCLKKKKNKLHNIIYYLVASLPMHLPPLRELAEDILLLFKH